MEGNQHYTNNDVDEYKNVNDVGFVNNSKKRIYMDPIDQILCGFILKVIKCNKNCEYLQSKRNGFIKDNITSISIMIDRRPYKKHYRANVNECFRCHFEFVSHILDRYHDMEEGHYEMDIWFGKENENGLDCYTNACILFYFLTDNVNQIFSNITKNTNLHGWLDIKDKQIEID